MKRTRSCDAFRGHEDAPLLGIASIVFSVAVLLPSAQSQDTRGECSRSNCQHKHGGSNAFDIAYVQMGHRRAHKIDHEADARRHSHGWPPDTENQAQCAGKLTGGQKRKVLQRHAYNFVDYVHDTRIAAYLAEAGKRHHRREEECNDQIWSSPFNAENHTVERVPHPTVLRVRVLNLFQSEGGSLSLVPSLISIF
jgi:hypothetical protein